MARVGITQKEAATEVGLKLIKALETILADGQITEREVLQLRYWLGRAMQRDNLPSVQFLAEEVQSIVDDGKITQEETWQLADAALRVLPPEIRQRYRTKVNEIRQNMPTERQRQFISHLGGDLPPNASKMDASELIDELLETRPSYRQRMVLKFWDRNDLLNAGKDAVIGWMDQFYEQDPDRLAAWELWKRETPNSQSRDGAIIDQIETGVGATYLNRVKEEKKVTAGPELLRTLAYSLLAILFLIVVYFVVFVR